MSGFSHFKNLLDKDEWVTIPHRSLEVCGTVCATVLHKNKIIITETIFIFIMFLGLTIRKLLLFDVLTIIYNGTKFTPFLVMNIGNLVKHNIKLSREIKELKAKIKLYIWNVRRCIKWLGGTGFVWNMVTHLLRCEYKII